MTDPTTQVGPDDVKNTPEDDTEGHRMARPDVNAAPGADDLRRVVGGPDELRRVVGGPDELRRVVGGPDEIK